ncbi:MAG: deoxyribodipyrimidine photo-lyase [Ignavibacteria bacterium]|nr:deoxyribodipyrimidine photo-lyase [Ignavibacteria bacterium]
MYWMSRDQRAHDNWALLFAVQIAKELQTGVIIAFSVTNRFLNAPPAYFTFMLQGLNETRATLLNSGYPFLLLPGEPEESIPECISQLDISVLISDFDPLKIKRIWKREIAKNINIPFYEVDAHNIVPCLLTSDKTEYGAYTIRPKIHRRLPEFLEDFPALPVQNYFAATDLGTSAPEQFDQSNTVSPYYPVPGESAASAKLQAFIQSLEKYSTAKNNPIANATSGLSPYLHFGHIAAQRVVLLVKQAVTPSESSEAFLEELIVRRELADNFCYFNRNYDSVEGFPEWARATLDKHANDPRDYIYSFEQFRDGLTHDKLWNAAQLQMVTTGSMPGYLRMYWAKKILEWSVDAASALHTSITLNNMYQLDGRDPNGYTGCAWSIGGVHDRPWSERPVFGMIRYMNESGCKRKFDVSSYIHFVDTLLLKK